MNKMDDAWAVMKKLPPRERKRAASAILDFAASLDGPNLTPGQTNQIKQRMSKPAAKVETVAKVRARLRKLEA
jgi:hypothetical protein